MPLQMVKLKQRNGNVQMESSSIKEKVVTAAIHRSVM